MVVSHDRMRLGLVYLPSPEVSARCVRYAESLLEGLTPRMLVGPGALPHLSLLHVESELPPQRLFDEALGALPPRCTFDILALGLMPYDDPYNAPPASPATMAWLIVPCSASLRALERAAVALAVLRGLPITTGNGDDFQPHLTIATWEGRRAPLAFAPPVDLIPTKGLEGRLALGIIGANGVYERTLFEA